MKINVIGDIAGNGNTLERLLDKMPKQETILLGDLNDRGPNTKKVYEIAMNNPNIKVVASNHGHLMTDAYRGNEYYDEGIWLLNGGGFTLKSFLPDRAKKIKKLTNTYLSLYSGFNITLYRNLVKELPEEIIEFEESLPKYILKDKTLFTHAPLHPAMTLEEALDEGTHASGDKCETSILWNIKQPIQRKEYDLQVFGHTKFITPEQYEDWGLCMDTTEGKYLYGYDMDEKKYYKEEVME